MTLANSEITMANIVNFTNKETGSVRSVVYTEIEPEKIDIKLYIDRVLYVHTTIRSIAELDNMMKSLDFLK